MRHSAFAHSTFPLRMIRAGLTALCLTAPVWAISPASAAAPATASAEAADPAAAQIDSFYGVLLDSMKNAKTLGVKGRYAKLKPVIEKTFALGDMMRIAAGPGWAKLTDAEKAALTAAFEKKTVAEYASNFDDYNGEKFVVSPTVRSRGIDKIVSSQLITAKMKVAFGYRMRQVDGSWKVLDIYLNGVISQLATQRSDFSAILAKKNGATALAHSLNAKADKLLSGK